MKAAPTEVALSAGVLALGIGAALVTSQLPSEGGYSHIGPNFFPAVVSGGLILLGLWLFAEAFAGGWRNKAERPPDEQPFQAGAFAWVSAGLFIHMAAIGVAGFVLAGTALFVLVARGFGSRRLVRDAALGFVLALAVHLFFVKLLNVSLPGGWLTPLLGTAGL